LPFTEQDYTRALRKVWPGLSQRQRAVLHNVRAYHETVAPAFDMQALAEYCSEKPPAFLSIVGHIGSAMAEHMGASVKPGDGADAPVWYGILFDRAGDSRILLNLRIPFAKSLKHLDDLPLP